MQIQFGDYSISDDKSYLQVGTILRFLAQSYWANQRSEEAVRKSIDNSICYGVYHGPRQIGFARIVTDHATMYWLCDVFVDDDYRGQGIGKRLIETIAGADALQGLTGILGTLDAHGLYEQYGFRKDESRFMRKRPELFR
ncbi:GNAT family N-acetyltransferase [Paenibacillus piri]|uniref:N-acetyltransferase n=1 Tax=Paenibacillus piri TaxID=2547395 RepID=A0A4R5KW52_9BACL|nr:GNAT family N-acetyltransferase [Paenibacillus piri]TDF99200.1 N-acetyltransferase [Paenibacillus piri]